MFVNSNTASKKLVGQSNSVFLLNTNTLLIKSLLCMYRNNSYFGIPSWELTRVLNTNASNENRTVEKAQK